MNLNSKNGFKTSVWGPCVWKFLHMVTMNYNPKFKKEYKLFFTSLQFILPCKHCRVNYSKKLNNKFKLTNQVLKNRLTLSKWLFMLHNQVRIDTGKHLIYKNTKKDFEQMLTNYSKFRAR
jgi:hypothetical protein